MYKRFDSVTIEEGYNYQITCPIIESSQFKISWRFNNRFLKSNSKVFRITKTRESDTGEYKCIASSLAGSASYIMRLTVLPKLKAVIKQHNKTWPINYQTKLVCQSNHPNSTIIWLKDSQKVSNSSIYSVEKARQYHGGTYVCQVESSTGWASSRTTIHVKGKLTFYRQKINCYLFFVFDIIINEMF